PNHARSSGRRSLTRTGTRKSMPATPKVSAENTPPTGVEDRAEVPETKASSGAGVSFSVGDGAAPSSGEVPSVVLVASGEVLTAPKLLRGDFSTANGDLHPVATCGQSAHFRRRPRSEGPPKKTSTSDCFFSGWLSPSWT